MRASQTQAAVILRPTKGDFLKYVFLAVSFIYTLSLLKVFLSINLQCCWLGKFMYRFLSRGTLNPFACIKIIKLREKYMKYDSRWFEITKWQTWGYLDTENFIFFNLDLSEGGGSARPPQKIIAPVLHISEFVRFQNHILEFVNCSKKMCKIH